MRQLNRFSCLLLCNAAVWAACTLFYQSNVWAQGTGQDRAAAQVLFDDGKALMKSARYADACPKFEESQRLDPRIATQFKLAECLELQGKTASAWTNFIDVAAATKAAGQEDREKVARDRAAALEKKLSKMTIVVPSAARVEGLEVKRDGVVVGKALWGSAVPVDPGEHHIMVSAPGKKNWDSTVPVKGEGALIAVNVPPLEDAPIDYTPPQPLGDGGSQSEGNAGGGAQLPRGGGPDRPEGGFGGQKIAGLALGVLGVGGVALGTVFGLQAKSKNDDSKAFCRTEGTELYCQDQGINLVNDAKSAATISTISFIAGGALAATGLVLFLTAPSPKTNSAFGVRAVAALGPGFSGARIEGAW